MPSFSLEAWVVLAGAFIVWRIWARVTTISPLAAVRGPDGHSYLTGHLNKIFDISTGLKFQEKMTAQYGVVVKLKGPFNADHLWISDPHALEEMLLREPDAFEERPSFTKGMRVIFGPGLLSSIGEQHKRQRKLLQPVFSNSNIRDLIPLFYDIAHQLRGKLEHEVHYRSGDPDILDWVSRVTLEFIGQGALGYSFGALEGHQNEYRAASKRLLPALAKLGFVRVFGHVFSTWGPPWFRRGIVELCPLPAVRTMKEIVDVMDRTSSALFYERKKLLAVGASSEQISRGKDILTLILALDTKSSNERLSDAEMRAQISTLLFAAHDSTSVAMARVLEMLTKHQDVQEKLRQEIIDATEAHSDLNYEQLAALPLLDAVCRETLRLHPPVTTIARECLRDVVLPLAFSIKSVDGGSSNQVAVPKGTTLWIGIRDANRRPEVWGDDADLWRPERWLVKVDANKVRLPGAYSSMMTFLGGERACIGFRIAVLEIKLLLAVLLPCFRFRQSSSSEIVWHLGATLVPFVKGKGSSGHDRGPELPMNIVLLADT